MAEIIDDFVLIYFYDLNDEAKKVVAEANGFKGLTDEEIFKLTNWDIMSGGGWPISKDE